MPTTPSEEAVRASVQRFDVVLRHSAFGMVMSTANRLILAANEPLCTLVGYTETELIGRSIDDLTWPDDVGLSQKASSAMQGGLQAAQIEKRFRRKDGQPIWILVSVSPIRGEDGALLHFLTQVQDITAQKKAEADLRLREAQYRTITRNLPRTLIFLLNHDLRITLVEGALALLALKPGMIEGRLLSEMLPPDRLAQAEPAVRAALSGHERVFEFHTPQERDLIVTAIPFCSPDTNDVVAAMCVARDVTELRTAEKAQHEAESRFTSAFDASSMGMALVDLKGGWIHVNKALCGIIGYTQAELRATTFQAVTHPDDLDADLDNVNRLLAGEFTSYNMEKRYLHKDGRVVWVFLTVSLVRDTQGRPLHFVAQVNDITERHVAEERLIDMALQDSLTGLANRRLFDDRLSMALLRANRSGQLPTVFYVDLDRFKQINDTRGHAIGDKVLFEVARRLNTVARGTDTVARRGGDEFVIIAEGLNAYPDVIAMARRLDKAFSAPIPLKGGDLTVTVSVGIATAQRGDTPETLLKKADAALYKAKADGRGRHQLYDDSLTLDESVH